MKGRTAWMPMQDCLACCTAGRQASWAEHWHPGQALSSWKPCRPSEPKRLSCPVSAHPLVRSHADILLECQSHATTLLLDGTSGADTFSANDRLLRHPSPTVEGRPDCALQCKALLCWTTRCARPAWVPCQRPPPLPEAAPAAPGGESARCSPLLCPAHNGRMLQRIKHLDLHFQWGLLQTCAYCDVVICALLQLLFCTAVMPHRA